MFRRKKKEEEEKKAEEFHKRQIEKVIKQIRPELGLPGMETFETYPTDYREFLKEIRQTPETLYEKLAAKAERAIKIKPPASQAAKLEENIRTAYLNATPSGVISLTILVLIFFALLVFLGLIFKLFDFVFALFVFLFGLGLAYLSYSYPASHAKALSMKMSSDIVLAILYMVIYMRSSPNMEGAVKFASQNLSGPLSWDLKKLLWDLEVGAYDSMDLAMVSYITKWKDKNQEFSEALHLLRNSLSEPESRRIAMLDESINVIMDGTRERMKHYAQSLRMPVMLVHALGVLLPVMGLVMFPIVVLLMSDVIKPIFIFIGYDILLPAFLFWYMNHVLESKPPTFSQPDISRCKDVPPLGKINISGRATPILPFALLAAVPLLFFGFTGLSLADIASAVNYSILIIFAVSLGIVVYCLLDSYQKIKVRNDIERIENEFAEALFQLGNQIAGGMPIEVAVDKACENLKNLKISELFLSVSINMKKLGMTFEEALFDKETGAVWRYPSKLIQSVMRTIVESSEKGVHLASMSMLTVSRYLKGLHNVKEEINDILGETTTSMKFLAMVLAPLVAGVTVTMAVIIIQILSTLSQQLASMLTQQGTLGGMQGLMLFSWGAGGAPPITPAGFQLVVGIYMIETVLLLSMFVNKIEYGEDEVGLRNTIYQILLIGTIIYIISWFFTYSLFGGPIGKLLAPV